MFVRAQYRAVTLPNAPAPYDRLLCKVFYPAQFSNTDMERNTGILPIIQRETPYPVVIFFNGMNVEKYGYQWLAESLVGAGYVVVLFDHLADVFGAVSVSAGIDLGAVRVGEYGTRPTSTTLHALLEALPVWNAEATFAGMLDAQNIVLGGHSAGGTLALHNANPRWFAGVRGAFTYGAHTMASTMLGYEAGTILPIAPESAYLLIGGTADGVIQASAGRYGETHTKNPIERTFEEAVTGGRGDCYYAMLDGATHFACVYPEDATTGRHFLEGDLRQQASVNCRPLMAELISAFVRQVCEGGAPLESTHALMATFSTK